MLIKINMIFMPLIESIHVLNTCTYIWYFNKHTPLFSIVVLFSALFWGPLAAGKLSTRVNMC
jgi:hypothetical protein